MKKTTNNTCKHDHTSIDNMDCANSDGTFDAVLECLDCGKKVIIRHSEFARKRAA
jgi:hypothetical protein